MPQQSLDRAHTPVELTVTIRQEPTQPELGTTISVRCISAGGVVLGRGATALHGIEADFLGTIVERLVETFMWGNPSVLHHVLRQSRRSAQEHAEKHRR